MAAVRWSADAACATADPDLFFPDEDTTDEQIAMAKQICSGCPVREACLRDAIQHQDRDAICGGLTPEERVSVQGGLKRRAGKPTPRQLAVQHGQYVLTCLVDWQMSVARVAEELGATRSAVYYAYMMLVPAAKGVVRSKRLSAIEELLVTSKECLRSLERRGLSQSEIATVLESTQSVVSACLKILRHRDEAVLRLSQDGQDGMARLQAEEMRVHVESGVGLRVDEVVAAAGRKILRMQGEGVPLRKIAAEIGINRESVRLAYRQMTTRTLNQNEMGEAA
ncbi:WhiB family transcriptional regulator [Streptomyces sp. NPDC008092]|uniref:WhiB family transcriptional regulator n=1 Tax=Streptomyces sp. NPDC008092 TaxID=3364808 RepID=UPI0036EF023E